MTKLKTKNIDTDTINLAAIKKEDPKLGRVLRLILDLPRPWPPFVATRLLGFVKKMIEPGVRQAYIDRKRYAEQAAKERAHTQALAPARDGLTKFAETVKAAGPMVTTPGDIEKLHRMATEAEIAFHVALDKAGLTERHPAVSAFHEIRNAEQAAV